MLRFLYYEDTQVLILYEVIDELLLLDAKILDNQEYY